MRVAHRVSKPRRLQHQMEALGPERIERGKVEILQDVEHHQRGEALPVRRDLEQVEAAVIGRDRRHHIAAMLGEILRRQERAARGNRRRHVVGDLAFVEGARALGGDGLQRLRQGRQAHDVAFLRRVAVEQIMLGGAGIGLELGDMPAPVPGDALRHRKAALGIFDRRLQSAREIEAAVRLEDRLPGIERARHGDGVHRGHADRFHALGAQRLIGGRGARAAGAVIAPDRFARLRHQRIAVAADAGAFRLDHAERGAGGDRGIRRRAAGAQRVDGGERRQRMRGRRHAFAGDDGRAAGQLEIAAHANVGMFVMVTRCAAGCLRP